MDAFLMPQSELEHGFGVEIVPSAEGKIDPGLTTDLKQRIADRTGDDVSAHFLVVRAFFPSR